MGDGGKHRKPPEDCGMCGGKGYTTCNKDNEEVRITCVGCNGSGQQP
ncbi:hypothetical protein J4H86_17225 [Spiractinospora alimapuensis]|nr:hypothetical protein [Spiractinospora alimapuensis]QVQ50634.1 hypothetical protein J4H86_17225 [Spiractinospora alimapuensis]